MKFLTQIARAVGLEGAFLLIAAVGLAVGSSFFHPAGPWLVVGGLALVIAITLTRRPARR